jgi:hypothetical protein
MSEHQRTALSVTALVVAVLGWTPLGQAARRVVFPANSVGTAQLKAQSVTSTKIRTRTIVNADIKPGSLLAASFRPGELPTGIEGLEIVTVPPGPDGFDTSAVKGRTISCPAKRFVEPAYVWGLGGYAICATAK